jgi:hypothetical protein
MRSPPVCGMRAVGFLSKRDWSGCSRSTRTTNEFPKAAIFAGGESESGKWSLVAEATPLGLWQARQLARSIT